MPTTAGKLELLAIANFLPLPRVMDAKWISALEALELVAATSNVIQAPRAICSRAHAGLVSARARRLIVDSKVKDDVDVPPEFWWANGQAALKQNWATGDFETWIDRRVHLQAFGVEFLRADIEAMMPARPRKRPVGAWEAGNYATAEKCLTELSAATGLDREKAGNVIVRNCRAGLVPSRCGSLWWRVSDRYGEEEHTEENCVIPDWVWEH